MLLELVFFVLWEQQRAELQLVPRPVTAVTLMMPVSMDYVPDSHHQAARQEWLLRVILCASGSVVQLELVLCAHLAVHHAEVELLALYQRVA